MDYKKMTIDSLCQDIFEKSLCRINKADICSRIEYLIQCAVEKNIKDIECYIKDNYPEIYNFLAEEMENK